MGGRVQAELSPDSKKHLAISVGPFEEALVVHPRQTSVPCDVTVDFALLFGCFHIGNIGHTIQTLFLLFQALKHHHRLNQSNLLLFAEAHCHSINPDSPAFPFSQLYELMGGIWKVPGGSGSAVAAALPALPFEWLSDFNITKLCARRGVALSTSPFHLLDTPSLHHLGPQKRTLQEFRRFVLDKLLVHPQRCNPSDHHLVVISRVTSRVFTTQPDVLASLSAVPNLRVTTADFAALSIRQQVELVSSATILLGVHSGSLAHMLWLPPSASVVQVQHSANDIGTRAFFQRCNEKAQTYINFEELASLLDLHFFYNKPDQVPQACEISSANFHLDPQVVLRLVADAAGASAACNGTHMNG